MEKRKEEKKESKKSGKYRVKGGFEGERLKKKKEREDGKDQDVKKVRKRGR